MKVIECPRDAMQGIAEFIPTKKKIRYLKQLLKVGFDTLDFGSFVSPKVIPQLKDTHEVLENLDLHESQTKLLAIIANKRGAEEAAEFDQVTYLGFPLSISETFQVRNTNNTLVEALNTVEEIQKICQKSGKALVIYISMGFGNPYGDPYSEELVTQFVGIMEQIGVKTISLADTIGVANPDSIEKLFKNVMASYSHLEIGVHLHSTPESANEKIDAAYKAGCRRMDGAIGGYGGCPMAKNELVGNLAMESIVNYMQEDHIKLNIDKEEFNESVRLAPQIFPN